MPDIELPVDLVEALVEGRLVLFAGAGISMPRFPSWKGLIETLLARAEELRTDVNDARVHLATGNLDTAAGALRSTLGPSRFQDAMSQVFRPPVVPPPTRRHTAIASTNFAAVVTTNYDHWIEATYRSLNRQDPPVRTNRSGDLGRLIEQRDFFILKAHGDIDDVNSWVVTNEDYELLSANGPYIDFMRTMARSYTHLFVGYSLRDPYLVRIRRQMLDLYDGRCPISFVALANATSAELDQLHFEQNLVGIPYEVLPGEREHHGLTACLELLARACPARVVRPTLDTGGDEWAEYTRALADELRERRNWYVELSVRPPAKSVLPDAEFARVLVSAKEEGPQYPLGEVASSLKHLILAGVPGAGKTTALEHLALDMIDDGFVPVLIPLSDLNADGPLALACQILRHYGVAVESSYLETLMRSTGFCLLLDGVNEIPRTLRQSAEVQLRSLLANYSAARIILTTRSHELPLVGNVPTYTIAPMGLQDVTLMVRRYLGEGRGDEMMIHLRNGPQELRDLSETPLFLKMLVSVFDQSGLIPANVGSLFRHFFSHVFRHREQVRGSIYSEDEKTAILSQLAFRMIQDSTLWLSLSQINSHLNEIITNLLALPTCMTLEGKLGLRSVVEELIDNGVLIERNHHLGLPHHAIADYFAARHLENVFVCQQRLAGDPREPAFFQAMSYLSGLVAQDASAVDRLLDLLLPANLALFANALGLSMERHMDAASAPEVSVRKWSEAFLNSYQKDQMVLANSWNLRAPAATTMESLQSVDGQATFLELHGSDDYGSSPTSGAGFPGGIWLTKRDMARWSPRAAAFAHLLGLLQDVIDRRMREEPDERGLGVLADLNLVLRRSAYAQLEPQGGDCA